MDNITSDLVLIGVDTHKDIHVAVAINGLGARLGSKAIPTTSRGYQELENWARALGTIHAFGIEGTGSYGAGLTRMLHNQGHRVVEVNRTNRQLRRQHGKSDPIDAEAAARAVLAGEADATPKTGGGCAEMIRHLKIARETAVKCRTQAMVTLKSILVNAPQTVRDQFQKSNGTMSLVRSLAALRPGELISTVASAKTALRSLARRWLALNAETEALDQQLTALAHAHAPELMAAPGISTQTVAEMTVSVGDNPERIRSEAAFAKLCGACPI
ncbi:MAG: IS110 family transposase, partial [Geminicoccaceae bacterium]